MNTIEDTRKQIRQAERFLLWTAILALALLAATAVSGFNIAPLFFWGALAAVPAAGAAVRSYARLRRLQTLLKLRERWQKEVPRERDFKAVAALHEYLQAAGGSQAVVDKQTWRDLNLDQIYALLDRTFTAEGQAVLYAILKTPCQTAEPLRERAALIRAFQEDASFREKLQLALLPLSGRSDKDTTELVWGRLPSPSPYTPLFAVLAAAALLSLAGPVFLGVQGLLPVIAMLGLNAIVHQRASRNITHMLHTISSLAALLRAALKVAALDKPELQARRDKLREASEACRVILKKTMFLQPKEFYSDVDLLYEYLKYFFLLEVRAFYAALGEIGRQAGRLREIYLAIGELDALQAVASYRESLTGYVEPVLSTGGAACCAVADARHPLVKESVPNSITLNDEGVLVTGSNMSGKSTFLRTMGVNAVFAQTIFTCLASSYRGSYFRVVTSISREDSIAEGKSYYYQEAERLLKLIRAAAAEEDTPAFCIIDELLSGTNYTERVAASEAILDHLARQNALVIVATHDLDLAEKLQGLYRCFHFTDQVGREGLYFDFKLKEGIASTRNAIKLLAYLGYPAHIVHQADCKAGQHGKKGG